MLTFEQIKELIELVAERHLQGLEVERSGFRLKIDGQAAAQPVVYASAPAGDENTAAPPPAPLPSRPAAAASAPPAVGAPAAAPASAEKSGHAPGTHILTSPIVGTFYRSPSPDSSPFVEVGSRVKKGQVLCIIEAMKLMNEIECDVDGVIAAIYPQNAQAVEFGEPLLAIAPA